jgi:ABC-type phosphate transport system permease subunit
VPLAPNGIGVRTWAVGLTIVLLHTLGLPTEADPDARAHDLAWNVALTADLVLLAVELVVAVPLGLASSAYLAKRRRTARSSPHDDPLQDTTPRR